MKNTYISLLFGTILFVGCTEGDKEKTSSVKIQEETQFIDPLSSWNDVQSKKEIIDFVNASIKEGGPGFIPVAERIATFDNDGTLWSEQPLYFQLAFAIDRIKEMAPNHPEWKTTMPYSAILEDDMAGLMAGGEHALIELVMTSHTNMTASEFQDIVTDWAASAVHPSKGKKYTELVYQPMLELLTFLQENEYKTYIVSGGGVDFMRPIVSEVYNIPPEQIIGSTIKTAYSYNDGNPKIDRLPELFFIDDKAGKPENIQRIIGRKPVIAGGNSDGDLAMLQWASSNKNFLNIYVHHTDSIREWAYDRESHIGKLDLGLDQATAGGWTVIDMEKDWEIVFPFEEKD